MSAGPATARGAEPLTLAIPFYRGTAHLREAVESVRAQTDPDWTLRVVDDGEGTDDAEAVVAAFGDPRMQVHRNPRNLGMAANWNRCLDLAGEGLVTLLHADDRLEPGYVEGMRGLAARYPEAVAVGCAARIVDARGVPTFSLADAVKPLFVPRGEPAVLRGEPALRALMAGNFLMCPTLCFRTRVLGARRFRTDWRQVQDLELTTRLLMEGETLVHTRARWYAYRRHPAGMTAVQSESLLRFDEEWRLFGEVAEAAEARGWRRAAATARRRGIVRLHVLTRALAALARLDPGRARRLWPYLVGRGPASGPGATR